MLGLRLRLRLKLEVKLRIDVGGVVGIRRHVVAGRVVVTAADVVVDDRRGALASVLVLVHDAVEAVAQDRQDAASRRRVDLQRPRARGLDSLGRVGLDVADQREA